ncbi:MAG: hypothetical protein MJ066_04335 [Clostridia bacterium]|nr:hypothetical protein [Clostridia bacterium]
MFVTKNQFYIFIACIAIGGLFGVLFSLSKVFKKIPIKTVGIITDVFSFVLTGVGFVFLSSVLDFPSLRFYMILGVIAGIFLYMRSFDIMLAKICKKAYNIIKRNKRIKTK